MLHNFAPGSPMDTVTQMNRRLAQQQEQMRLSTQKTLRIVEERNRPVSYNTTPLPLPQAQKAGQRKRRGFLMRLLGRKG